MLNLMYLSGIGHWNKILLFVPKSTSLCNMLKLSSFVGDCSQYIEMCGSLNMRNGTADAYQS